MYVRTFILCFLCIVIAGGLFFAGSCQLDEINRQRSEMRLVVKEPLENAPPSLAFVTIALGSFRGLIVDILWLRATQLKEDGKFFDAKQLAEWITLLQPRFASVWDFHAWNMAYNISVEIPATRPQERWQWVRNGYELLRDKGIEKNPHSVILYRALGWIFQHKIAGETDDCHKYYKLQLYNAMKVLVDPQTQEHYKALADSPKEPGDIFQKPEVAKFLNELASADSSFSRSEELVDNYLSLRQQPSRFSEEAFAVIDDFRGTKALEEFDTFAKAYQLRHKWKLEPELMVELNEKYGPIDYKDPNKLLPLDWTLPDTHSIYWAALGLQKMPRETGSVDELNTDRIVFQGLQHLYYRGKMVLYTSKIPSKSDPCDIIERQSVFLFPDLRMFGRYDQALRELIKKYDRLGGNVAAVKSAHKNMLKRAVFLFYQAGHMGKATEIYNVLRKEYPEDEDIHASLTDYVRKRFILQCETSGISDAREMITLMLREAYYHYAVGNDDDAFGREWMAMEIYDNYQEGLRVDGADRAVLPDFDVLKYIGLIGFLGDARYPDYIRENILSRIQVERPELYKKLEQQHESFMEEMGKQESMQQ
ncbi:MAG: hypothetical protein JW806_05320 [Sedimentisphaerales bacterium]|nr:hypothetical protein [Sedimentisphaerales bacterium]